MDYNSLLFPLARSTKIQFSIHWFSLSYQIQPTSFQLQSSSSITLEILFYYFFNYFFFPTQKLLKSRSRITNICHLTLVYPPGCYTRQLIIKLMTRRPINRREINIIVKHFNLTRKKYLDTNIYSTDVV